MTVPVSVVIPTFKRPDALAETLRALRHCSPAPREILVMVDHGDCETRTALEPKHREVRWHQARERLGPGGARNILLTMAQCPYVASFDDDSIPIDPDYFAQIVALFEAHPKAAVVAAGAVAHNGERVPSASTTIVPVAEFVGCAAAIRREAFLETTGYRPLELAYGAEEVDVSLQLLDKGWLIMRSDALRVRHRTSRSNQVAPDVTGAHIANTALVGYLRYPLVLWWFVVLQIGRRVYWSVRNGRSAGVFRGLASIPRNVWRHRAHRAPVKAHVIFAARRLRGSVRELNPAE